MELQKISIYDITEGDLIAIYHSFYTALHTGNKFDSLSLESKYMLEKVISPITIAHYINK